MLRRLGVALIVLLNIVLSGCISQQSGIDLEAIDETARPQDDFYRFANGLWIDGAEIPKDRPSISEFLVLHEKNQELLRELIEEEAGIRNRRQGTERQKISDLYESFMDISVVNSRGLTPLQDEIDRINKVTTHEDILRLMGHYEVIGIGRPISLYVDQDFKDATRYIIYITQSGLGLPDRDYYFNEGERFQEIRSKYVSHIEGMLSLAGQENAGAKAMRIMELETKIAAQHWTRVENRDNEKTYNKYGLVELSDLTPHIEWSLLLDAAQVSVIEELIVRQPSYLKSFDQVFYQTEVDDWKAYFQWRLITSFAGFLPDEFADADFDFYGKTLQGIEEQPPRWKKAVGLANRALGDLLGQIYVEKHFDPAAKQRVEQLVDNIKLAFKDRIQQLDWMGSETKEAAIDKLAKLTAKIGYPTKWKDYTGLEIDEDELIKNVIAANTFLHQREIGKLGKPVDREEWFIPPQTVNAFYSPNMNEIVFPAAILQPPFFIPEADDAVNYGAIGAIIGHELTHGFDDQGRKSDGEGNLRDWWTERDAARFQERARVLIAQYERYYPIESIHINGELTLGENIADLGGLTIAYHAYVKSLNGKKAPVVDGYSGEQRLFMGFARIQRGKIREEKLRERLLTDPHSPGQYRINGVVTNMPEFYDAFNVKIGDELYRGKEERAEIW